MAVKTDAITAVKGCNPYDLFYTQECEYNTCEYRCMVIIWLIIIGCEVRLSKVRP